MVRQHTMGILILLALIFLAACTRDDAVVLPEDQSEIIGPSIDGDYTGTYRFLQIENGIDTTIDTTQDIRLQLRSGQYLMSLGDLADSTIDACSVVGTYELGAGVNMSVADSNYTRAVCPRPYGFGGSFALDQSTDTLRLLSDQLDSLGVRQIRELKIVLD